MKRIAALALVLSAPLALPSCRSGEEDPGTPGPPEVTSEAAAAESPVAALPSTPAGRLVARSVDFHDPEGVWWSRPVSLRWVSSRPGGEERVARLAIDDGGSHFHLDMELRGHQLEMALQDGSLHTAVDGSRDFTPEVAELLRLDREEGLYWRNYFLFLVGLPMKLTDPGAELAEEVASTEFDGRPVEAVRVRYDTDDGYPWWEFYFEPADGRFVGARFWREGPDVDGEYITMEGLAEAGPLRIPEVRRWYTNARGEHLGTDRVEGLEVGEG